MHGISFEVAKLAFYDPYARFEQDREVDGEPRWQVLGWAGDIDLLIVAHTFFDEDGLEHVRIISARRAIAQERKRYGKNR